MIKYRPYERLQLGRYADIAGITSGGQQDRSGTPQPPIETIGRYRITRLIGEGGMGAVYEAEQDKPRRTVALKVIKPGMASPEMLRRFAQECQALGRLQHPGIARNSARRNRNPMNFPPRLHCCPRYPRTLPGALR
jgi:serine/threonine protein kinase